MSFLISFRQIETLTNLTMDTNLCLMEKFTGFKQIVEASQAVNTTLNPDSDAAFWEEDHTGGDNADVMVTDHFDDGTVITFVWNRKKSNQNINDTGGHKGGFSFYRARYVYRDNYLYQTQKDDIKITTPGGKGVTGTVYDGEKRAAFAVQEKDEGKDEHGNRKIRIISAAYANDSLRLKYLERKDDMATREGKYIPHKQTFEGSDEHIRLLHLEHEKLMKKNQS